MSDRGTHLVSDAVATHRHVYVSIHQLTGLRPLRLINLKVVVTGDLWRAGVFAFLLLFVFFLMLLSLIWIMCFKLRL